MENQSLSFTLPPVMTIENAESLAAELKQLPFAGNHCLTLDASQVEHITTPGLQLVLSLGKTMELQGGMLAIRGQNNGFSQAFKDAGLGEWLLSATAA